MHLVYFDESGNTGNNLTDPQQPVFVLCALVVPESCWLALESDLETAFSKHFTALAADTEVHAADIRSGRGVFRAYSIAQRIQFRDEWMSLAKAHSLKVVYRGIEKRRYQNWLTQEFGGGVLINPHVVAFALVARVVNEYLATINELGVFISDDNKEIAKDVEKSLKALKGVQSPLRLSKVVEKGFFIDSRKSRVLQLCDLFALFARKTEERKLGMRGQSADDSAVALLNTVYHSGDEMLIDVVTWFAQQRKAVSSP